MSAGSARILSKTRTKVDETNEWEQHMVLRVPNELRDEVEKCLDHPQSSSNLAVSFTHSNMRQANVRIGDKIVQATVQDLPCIVEVQKTLDKKVSYKVADISQIMVASAQETSSDQAATAFTSTESLVRKELKKYQYPHGLTPPMKSARVRRFRKTKKKKFMDVPEVEQELKRLLRADLEAESIRWEVVSVDDKKDVKEFDAIGDKISSSSEDDEAPHGQAVDAAE
ncbi:unnamed protein product, partial [Mesorhabditis spiculigera]